MGTDEGIVGYLRSKRELAFELIRIYVGIGLFVKGWYFVQHQEVVLQLMEDGQMLAGNVMLAHYIAIAHLVGGALLAIGLLTRLAALAQIPVLVGATFVVTWRQGILGNEDFQFAALVLFVLVLALLFGGGKLSADARIFDSE